MARPVTGPYYTQPGRRRIFGKLHCWAEDGLIFCEWQTDGERAAAGDAEVMSIADAKHWLRTMQGDLEKWDRAREGAPTPKDRAYAIEYFHTLKGQLQVIDETIRDAIDQGDQHNPEVRRRKLREFLRSRRGTTVNNETLPSINSQVDALFFPGMNGNVMVYPGRRQPVAVLPPELPPNWRG